MRRIQVPYVPEAKGSSIVLSDWRGLSLRRGSSRHGLGVGPKAGIPRAEGLLPFAVQHAGANLQQEMGTALAPLHLLFFHHPLADHLVHGRFNKARADTLPLAIALAVVRNQIGIIFDVRVELLHRFEQLP